MSKIKFSHQYEKMPPGWERSQLLEVFDKDYIKLSEEYIKYDTEIKTYQDPASDYIEPKKYYNLPKGSLLILLLLSSKGHLWTTIRRCTPDKRGYYMMMRGAVFDCVIEQETP